MKRACKVGFKSVACLCAIVVLAGCSGKGKQGDIKGAKVSGRLVFNAQPIRFLQDEEIKVSFSDADDKTERAVGASATVNEDGTFTINGPSDQGIPAKKYQVIVTSQIYSGDGTDRFAALFEEGKPPLIADVGDQEGQTFVIDLGKRQVTKQ